MCIFHPQVTVSKSARNCAFRGFDEPYRTTLLGEIASLVNRTDPKSNAPIMMLSAGNGFIMQSEKYSRDNAGQSLKKYILLKQGELAYNHGASKAKQFGCCYELTEPEARIPYVYHCFKINEDEYTPYVAMALNNAKMDQQLKRLVSSSVRMDGLLNISFEDYMSVTLHLPSFIEQKHIADFLTKLDERIAYQERLITSLKKYKRGLHKLVFIKKRKHSWEKSALHDIASFCGGGTPSKDVSSYWEGEIGWISSSDIQEEWIDDISVTRRITKTAIDNSATKLCPEGTIAIVSRVGVGKVAIMPESLCTSQDFTNITSITGNTHYMAYQIAFRMKLEAMKTQGTSIKGVTADTIKAMVLDIPPLEEQKKIADMLTAFDAYIKRAVCELDLFLAMKKALLQQLFI